MDNEERKRRAKERRRQKNRDALLAKCEAAASPVAGMLQQTIMYDLLNMGREDTHHWVRTVDVYKASTDSLPVIYVDKDVRGVEVMGDYCRTEFITPLGVASIIHGQMVYARFYNDGDIQCVYGKATMQFPMMLLVDTCARDVRSYAVKVTHMREVITNHVRYFVVDKSDIP